MESIISDAIFNRSIYRSHGEPSGGGGSSHRETSAVDIYEGVHLDDLLHITKDQGASDLHFQSGSVPTIRVNGELKKVGIKSSQASKSAEVPPMKAQQMIYDLLRDDLIEKFENAGDIDFSYALPKSEVRFRVNVYRELAGIGASFRLIPNTVPTIEALHLPDVVRDLADLPRGLVLVTGPTGSGKSTTLAAIVNRINETHGRKIITIEDPIEYTHTPKKSFVTQREVGPHTKSFAVALRAALREDPDVIVVGELRDLETIQIAVTAAETGHLVFATLHTPSAAETIDRVVDVFPPDEKEHIRVLLGNNLQWVLAQTLVPRIDNNGRLPAMEIMKANDAIRHLIRKNNTHQIDSHIQMGGKDKMQTMDTALVNLVQSGLVSEEEAKMRAQDKGEFERLLKVPTRNGGGQAHPVHTKR